MVGMRVSIGETGQSYIELPETVLNECRKALSSIVGRMCMLMENGIHLGDWEKDEEHMECGDCGDTFTVFRRRQ